MLSVQVMWEPPIFMVEKFILRMRIWQEGWSTTDSSGTLVKLG